MEKPRGDSISRDDFMKFVAKMKEVFPQNFFIPTIASANEWYKALREYRLDQLTQAFETYIKINTNPPSVAELRNIVSISKKRDQFDEKVYWESHTYWVLTDLDGNYINECISEVPCTADEIRAFFVGCGYDLSGTVLKPIAYKDAHPKVGREVRQKITKEELQKTFHGIDIEEESGTWEDR